MKKNVDFLIQGMKAPDDILTTVNYWSGALPVKGDIIIIKDIERTVECICYELENGKVKTITVMLNEQLSKWV